MSNTEKLVGLFGELKELLEKEGNFKSAEWIGDAGASISSGDMSAIEAFDNNKGEFWGTNNNEKIGEVIELIEELLFYEKLVSVFDKSWVTRGRGREVVENILKRSDDFKLSVRHEFSFLVNELGFVETKCFIETSAHGKIIDLDSVKFEKENIYVHINEIGFGSPLGVSVGRYNLAKEVKEDFPLEDIVSFRNPCLLDPDILGRRNPVKNLQYSAMALSSCAADILQNNLSDIPKLRRHIYKLDTNDKKRWAHRMERKANRAFRAGNWNKVVRILKPVRQQLGSGGISLLMAAEAKSGRCVESEN